MRICGRNGRIPTVIDGTLLGGDDGCERLSLGPFETAVKTFTPDAGEEQVIRFQLTGH